MMTRTRQIVVLMLLTASSILLGDFGRLPTVSAGESPAASIKSDSSKSKVGAKNDAVQLAHSPVAMKKINIHCTCVDDDSHPVLNARVRVYRYPSISLPPILVVDAYANDNGTLELFGIESAVDKTTTGAMFDLFVAVTADDRTFCVKRVDDEKDDLQLTFELLKNPQTLSGVVIDTAGRPVNGVIVNWNPASMRPVPNAFNGVRGRGSEFTHPLPDVAFAITDKHGRYTIHGLRGTAKNMLPEVGMAPADGLRFEHPDYAPTFGEYSSIPDTVNVMLKPFAIVEGEVTDDVTGKPAANVLVTAEGIARGGWFETRTDANGNYQLRMVGDYYNIWADANDRISVAAKAVGAISGEITTAHISLVRGNVIVGSLIVSGAEKRLRPTPRLRLTVVNQGPARPTCGLAVTSTDVDQDGVFRLRVAPGLNHLHVKGIGLGTIIDTGVFADGEEIAADLKSGNFTNADLWERFEADDKLQRELRRWSRVEDRNDWEKLNELLKLLHASSPE